MGVLEIPSPGWRSTRWNCCACIFGDCVATLHRGVISPIANEVRTSGASIPSKSPRQSKPQARKVNLTAKFNFDSIIVPRDSFARSGIISIVRCISQSVRPFSTVQVNLGEDSGLGALCRFLFPKAALEYRELSSFLLWLTANGLAEAYEQTRVSWVKVLSLQLSNFPLCCATSPSDELKFRASGLD